MISLLPPNVKQTALYSRRNRYLLRWVSTVLLALVGIWVLVGVGELYLAQETKSYAAQVAETNDNLSAQHLDDVEKQVQDFSNNLKLITQVLSKEVLFSKLIQQIGSVMPQNAVLSTIEISKVEGGLDLQAKAVDYKTATQVQVNLQDPSNKLFDKVDIVAVNCGGSKDQYQCTIILRAAFTKNNPFLFINAKGTP